MIAAKVIKSQHCLAVKAYGGSFQSPAAIEFHYPIDVPIRLGYPPEHVFTLECRDIPFAWVDGKWER
jgi:hypothetical protein